jgi:hypothetical protein
MSKLGRSKLASKALESEIENAYNSSNVAKKRKRIISIDSLETDRSLESKDTPSCKNDSNLAQNSRITNAKPKRGRNLVPKIKKNSSNNRL